jgi:hypothetical protein
MYVYVSDKGLPNGCVVGGYLSPYFITSNEARISNGTCRLPRCECQISAHTGSEFQPRCTWYRPTVLPGRTEESHEKRRDLTKQYTEMSGCETTKSNS